jgi:hypothetical protein
LAGKSFWRAFLDPIKKKHGSFIFQVFDYDFALRDDFIGEATISLAQLDIDLETDLVLTLVETGKFEYLGQGTMLYNSLPS